MQIQGLIWRGHCESKYWHQEKNKRDKLNLKSWSQLKTSVTGWISQQILALMEKDDGDRKDAEEVNAENDY